MKSTPEFIATIHNPLTRRLATLTQSNPLLWRPLAAGDLSPAGTAGVKTGHAASNDARRRYQPRWYGLLGGVDANQGVVGGLQHVRHSDVAQKIHSLLLGHVPDVLHLTTI